MSNDRNFEANRIFIHKNSSLPIKKQGIKRGIDLIKCGVNFFDAPVINEDTYPYVSDTNTEEVSSDTLSYYTNDCSVFAEQKEETPFPLDCDFKPQSFANEQGEFYEKNGAADDTLLYSAKGRREVSMNLPLEQRELPTPEHVPSSRSFSKVGNKHHHVLMSKLLSSMEKSETSRAEVQKLDISLAKKAIALKKKKQNWAEPIYC